MNNHLTRRKFLTHCLSFGAVVAAFGNGLTPASLLNIVRHLQRPKNLLIFKRLALMAFLFLTRAQSLR